MRLIAITLLTVLFVFLLDAADAHSWYPRECCEPNDCKPVACTTISIEERRNAQGFSIQLYAYSEVPRKPMYILAERALPSPDEGCHVCPWSGTQTLRCLWVPMPTN